MGRPAVTFTVKGIDNIQRGWRSLRQPELSRTAKPLFQEGSRKIFVPEVKTQAKSASRYSPGPSRSRGKRGKRGPLARNVTTRLVKARSAKKHNALFAYRTGPRAWYAHFVIRGTRPHSLAKGAKLRGQIRQNVGRQHRGARGNAFVDRAQKAGERRFMSFITQGVVRVWKQRARAK